MNERLIGRFVKAVKSDGSLDFDGSSWVVSLGDSTLSTTTVAEFCAADPDLNYDIIATRQFGTFLLQKTRNRLNKLKNSTIKL